MELGPYALGKEQATFRFMKGLQTNIHVFTNMSRPQNFASACETAVAAESSLQGTFGYRSNNTHNSENMDLGYLAGPRQ